jgi:glucose/arabinose dehydrogenase
VAGGAGARLTTRAGTPRYQRAIDALRVPCERAGLHASPRSETVAWIRLLTLAVLVAAGAGAQARIPGLDTRIVASGLNQPVLAVAPLSDGRLFVVERGGRIKVVQGGVASPFLNILVATAGEQGLLGLAFDPDYGNAGRAGYGRFFVDYIEFGSRDTVIASFRVGADGAVTPGSRVEVMRIDQPPDFNNHKAGWIGFKPGDPDHLYIATGDGGSAYDPSGNGQNRGVLLGKLLRVDVNADDFADPDVNYGVPDDNPFVGVAGTRGEIFAYGLRNPWRNGFDRLTGDLWVADVGQGEREEVNFIAAASPGGQNFGWRLREGDIPTPGVGGDRPADNVDPIFVYDHVVGRSITGGHVVRDAGSPLDGHYVFADYVFGTVWATTASDPSFAGAIDITAALEAGAGGALGNISSFGFGAGGEFYIVDYGGKVVQVVPEPSTRLMLAAGLGVFGLRRRRVTG